MQTAEKTKTGITDIVCYSEKFSIMLDLTVFQDLPEFLQYPEKYHTQVLQT